MCIGSTVCKLKYIFHYLCPLQWKSITTARAHWLGERLKAIKPGSNDFIDFAYDYNGDKLEDYPTVYGLGETYNVVRDFGDAFWPQFAKHSVF